MKIEKAEKTGFCFGVRRAVNRLEKLAEEHGTVETLGAVVHNEQVLKKLAASGVKFAEGIADIKGKVVVTSTHGTSPALEEQLRARDIQVISTTCPFVRRAQTVARRFAEAGFFVIVFGDANHPEVRGILGWTKEQGIATTNEKFLASLQPLPRRIGILSQTTQVPAQFVTFAQKIIGAALTMDSEIRIYDTICHDIRERQTAALALAKRVDLMLVIGGRHSANTKHLAELCGTATETQRIETAAEIQPAWLKGKQSVGVTGGASTAADTVADVIRRLEELA